MDCLMISRYVLWISLAGAGSTPAAERMMFPISVQVSSGAPAQIGLSGTQVNGCSHQRRVALYGGIFNVADMHPWLQISHR